MDLQTTMDTFKGGENLLVGLQDVLQDSQTIGSASRIFWSMEKVNKIVVLGQETVKIIQDKMKGVDPDDQKNLDQLLLVDNQLTTVYAQIDGVKKSTLPPLTSDLSSLHPVFSLTKSAPGSPMDFLEIGRSVEKLNKDITLTPEQLKSLLEVTKNLETLDTFGLDYAKHHKDIDKSKKALNQMDLFFADYKSKGTVIPTTTGAPVESSTEPMSSEAPLHSDASPGALGPSTEDESTGIWFIFCPTFITC
ncbi:hypothetical protein GCK72_011613 [Caenorhabditis remanei]|uniref:Domain of unknown function WSN domain-containing protein n=1 Tax=Caenorhabditis remanei TaxID=31234 RepID=A0A6A5H824_CAERE|nr:hypothetical protein GCK72_011613 [Caenorhabditis remanei]KAF1763347.1 hypothetical protein GCK72_011613 [Caenorhabditis remanei]